MSTIAISQTQSIESNFFIPVFQGTLNGVDESLVDARTLHNVLRVGKTFAAWIRNRIAEYGFNENQDFIFAIQNGKAKQRGGHNKIDYHLSLDMAKELAMIEKTDIGRMVRRYFIQCERIANKLTGRSTTRDERTGLRSAVNAVVGKKGMLFPEVYKMVHQRFNVEHIDELTLAQVNDAVEYLHRLVLDIEKQEENKATVVLPSNWEPLIISSLACHAVWSDLHPIVKKINEKAARSMNEYFYIMDITAKSVAQSIGYTVKQVKYPWKNYSLKKDILVLPENCQGDYVLRVSQGNTVMAQLPFLNM